MRKSIVLYDKPIQIGFAILDIPKVIVNRLYYILKKHYENIIALYTDTDSLKIIVKYIIIIEKMLIIYKA